MRHNIAMTCRGCKKFNFFNPKELWPSGWDKMFKNVSIGNVLKKIHATKPRVSPITAYEGTYLCPTCYQLLNSSKIGEKPNQALLGN